MLKLFNIIPEKYSAVLFVVIAVISLIALCELFKMARVPGWKALIPIYNLYWLSKLVFGKGWLFLLLFIPVINVIYGFLLIFNIPIVYDKGIIYAILIFFIPPVILFLLAFGNTRYGGPYRAS